MSTLVERLALDEMEPEWAQRGYKVIRQPSPPDVPEFLKGFQPDAIAVGKEPSLLIEVVQPRSEASDYKIQQIQKLLEGRNDWRLEVIYAPSEAPFVDRIDSASVEDALAAASRLAETEPRAALLLAWAALEAALSLQFPREGRGRSSGAFLSSLLDAGDITQEENSRLRHLSQKRAAIAHGQLDMTVSSADALEIIRIGERLLGTVQFAN